MATQTLVLGYGLAAHPELKVDIFPLGSDVAVSTGLSLASGVFNRQWYTTTREGTESGWHICVLKDDEDEVADGPFYVKLADADGIYYLTDTPPAELVGGADVDLYHADIQFTKDSAQDEYSVVWFRNGVRVSSGITLPTIQVVKRADGTNLIASSAMTQVGATGAYKYDATGAARQTAGEAVYVIVGATIDGGSRSFIRVLGRDA